MGGNDQGTRQGLLSGYFDEWQGPPEPEESRRRRQELALEQQRATLIASELFALKHLSGIDHLSDDGFRAAFGNLSLRLGVGTEENPQARYLKIIAGMLPLMPEFSKPKGRPKGKSGVAPYKRWMAVNRRRMADSSIQSDSGAIRILMDEGNEAFPGDDEGFLKKEVSVGKAIARDVLEKILKMEIDDGTKARVEGMLRSLRK